MRPPNRLAALALVLALVGAPVLFLFANPVTLTVGALLLVAFVVVGLFAIATPDYLAGTDESAGPEEPAD